MPDRISAIIIKDKKLLIITGYDESIWWTPGGKMEKGEEHTEALRRELKEELGVDLKSIKKYDEKLVINSITNKPQQSYFYLVKISGEIEPQSEITKYHWLKQTEAKDYSMSDVMREVILPRLSKENLI